MSTAGPTGWRRWGPWVGAAGMLVALWFYGFVGLVAPWWAVPLVALSVIAWQNAATRPAVSLAMPVVAMTLWFAIVWAGGAWFDWTA
jgi:hypothetical protein